MLVEAGRIMLIVTARVNTFLEKTHILC